MKYLFCIHLKFQVTWVSCVLSDPLPSNTSTSPFGCVRGISSIKYQSSGHSFLHQFILRRPHLLKRQLHSSNCSNQKHHGHLDARLFLTSQLIYHYILLGLTWNTTYSESDLFSWSCCRPTSCLLTGLPASAYIPLQSVRKTITRINKWMDKNCVSKMSAIVLKDGTKLGWKTSRIKEI